MSDDNKLRLTPDGAQPIAPLPETSSGAFVAQQGVNVHIAQQPAVGEIPSEIALAAIRATDSQNQRVHDTQKNRDALADKKDHRKTILSGFGISLATAAGLYLAHIGQGALIEKILPPIITLIGGYQYGYGKGQQDKKTDTVG